MRRYSFATHQNWLAKLLRQGQGSLIARSPVRADQPDLFMDWENEPATWKQLKYLKQHGYKPDRHLTKTAAAELIVSMGGPGAVVAQAPVDIPIPMRQSPKEDAYQLHSLVEQAAKAVSAARREDLHKAEQNLALAISKREMFWIDTCRDPMRMQAACGAVLDFYRKYGCSLEAPSNKQVREVLVALDSALPQWEREHPELFYTTLELNYPELKKRR